MSWTILILTTNCDTSDIYNHNFQFNYVKKNLIHVLGLLGIINQSFPFLTATQFNITKPILLNYTTFHFMLIFLAQRMCLFSWRLFLSQRGRLFDSLFPSFSFHKGGTFNSLFPSFSFHKVPHFNCFLYQPSSNTSNLCFSFFSTFHSFSSLRDFLTHIPFIFSLWIPSSLLYLSFFFCNMCNSVHGDSFFFP